MEISITTVGFENGKNLKLFFFFKNAYKRKYKRHLYHQNHIHKIVHASAIFYQNLNVIGEPSKTVTNDEKFFFLIAPSIIN